MPNLTDYIEDYLKKLLALSSSQYIEIKRRELAGKFSCVPSQINYVLERRFPLERGYLVQSRRGGGGCIRIYRIETLRNGSWRDLIDSLDRLSFDLGRARQLVKRMVEDKIISRREAAILDQLLREDLYLLTSLNSEELRLLLRELFVNALQELLKIEY
ncbi:MAG: CtsR family transcriptional regulator [Firmicutes bacterium]|nr:CtsR family transcriptional regulator [Bacillota bacterium]